MQTGIHGSEIALLVVVIILSASWESWRTFQIGQRTAAHARRILEESAAPYARLRDAETGQRGYLLTGRDACLQPCYAGAAETSRHLGALIENTRADAAHKMAADRLKLLVSAKLSFAGGVQGFRRSRLRRRLLPRETVAGRFTTRENSFNSLSFNGLR